MLQHCSCGKDVDSGVKRQTVTSLESVGGSIRNIIFIHIVYIDTIYIIHIVSIYTILMLKNF